ncbi:hypothetical protein AYO20_11028 [Fonsecaea nubica]|uniref:C2H2-type domain-containing protein n=1 Tax=Fonsecaea nubica TaxID=856822 RepID=A0A178C1T8_9EURO|nr:hypothetical protein AYO20_11028 [Fonsecaea nubica]OAL23216.1 hypothetical protein AYO20_11028 [Fonsecaea nubica]
MGSSCVSCNRTFRSEEGLRQHMRDSPAHASNCETCNRSFGSAEALKQHLRDSPFHKQPPETPLDSFFRSFPTFVYDPSLPPSTSYARLRRHQGWRRDDTASQDAWTRYQDALASELRMWFGSEDDLKAWHSLCRAIGVTPLPRTCRQCEQAVRRTHVNIVDLIEWGRRRGGDTDDARVPTFRNEAELRTYTKKTRKIFRNTLEHDNVVLRHLLRHIFGTRR